jgi:hypothetical protein
MIGKININGQLEIFRQDDWIIQKCPFSDRPCGYECPLFYGLDNKTIKLCFGQSILFTQIEVKTKPKEL